MDKTLIEKIEKVTLYNNKYKDDHFKKMLFKKELIECSRKGIEDKNKSVFNLYQKTIFENIDNDNFMDDFLNFSFSQNKYLSEQQNTEDDQNQMKQDIKEIKEYLKRQNLEKMQQQREIQKQRELQNDPEYKAKKTIGNVLRMIISSAMSITLFRVIGGGMDALSGVGKGAPTVESENINIKNELLIEDGEGQTMEAQGGLISKLMGVFSGVVGLMPGLKTALGIATAIGIAAMIWGEISAAKQLKYIRNKADKIKGTMIKIKAATIKGDQLANRSNNARVLQKWAKRKQKLMNKYEKYQQKYQETTNKIKQKQIKEQNK
jgi:hypothetical protein